MTMTTPTYITAMVKPETASDILYGMAKVAGKFAPYLRGLIKDEDFATIATTWIRLDAEDDTKALAKLRTELSRQGKKVLGHGLTVKNGKVQAAGTNSKTTITTDPKLVELAKIVETNGSAEIKEKLIQLMETYIESQSSKGEAK